MIKNPPANARHIRDVGSIPGSGISPGGGQGDPLQYSGLENPMDREATDGLVCGIAKSWTCLSGFHFDSVWILFSFRSLPLGYGLPRGRVRAIHLHTFCRSGLVFAYNRVK